MTTESRVRRAISDALTRSAAAYFNGEHERAARLRIVAQRLRGNLQRMRVRQETAALTTKENGNGRA